MWRSAFLGILFLIVAEGGSRLWQAPAMQGNVRAWTIHNTIDTAAHPEILPLAGLANAPTYLCKEASGDVTYLSDQHGFHNPEWNSSPDVLLLGDSYIQGHCVPEDKQLATILRRGGKSVLNLGLRGSGPLSQLGAMLEYSKKPKKILWFLLANDFLYDLERELAEPKLVNYLAGKTQGLKDRQLEINELLQNFGVANAPPTETLGFASLLNQLFFRLLRPEPSRAFASEISAKMIEPYVAILAEGKRLAPAPVEFIFVPDSWMFSQQEGPELRALVAQLKTALDAKGIHLQDPTEIYSQNPFHYFAPMDGYYGHYNEAGFKALADFVNRKNP